MGGGVLPLSPLGTTLRIRLCLRTPIRFLDRPLVRQRIISVFVEYFSM